MYSAMRDLTIRLLYWSVIRKKFQQAYAAQIAPGFQEAGIAMPDFSKLTRAATLKVYQQLTSAAKGGEAQKALNLVEGYYFLDTKTVPTTWV
jgi:hypothetical protein